MPQAELRADVAGPAELLQQAAAHIAVAERHLAGKPDAKAADSVADAASEAIAVLQRFHARPGHVTPEIRALAAAVCTGMERLNERMRHTGTLQFGRLASLGAGQLGYARGGNPVCNGCMNSKTLAEI